MEIDGTLKLVERSGRNVYLLDGVPYDINAIKYIKLPNGLYAIDPKETKLFAGQRTDGLWDNRFYVREGEVGWPNFASAFAEQTISLTSGRLKRTISLPSGIIESEDLKSDKWDPTQAEIADIKDQNEKLKTVLPRLQEAAKLNGDGDKQNALDKFIAVRKLFDNESLSKTIASLYSQLGKPKESLNEFEQLSQKYPNKVDYKTTIAWLLAKQPTVSTEDANRAVDLAKEAIKSKPDDAQYQDTLAAAYAAIGDFDKAIAAQNVAIKLNTDNKYIEEFGARLTLYVAGKRYIEGAGDVPAPAAPLQSKENARYKPDDDYRTLYLKNGNIEWKKDTTKQGQYSVLTLAAIEKDGLPREIVAAQHLELWNSKNENNVAGNEIKLVQAIVNKYKGYLILDSQLAAMLDLSKSSAQHIEIKIFKESKDNHAHLEALNSVKDIDSIRIDSEKNEHVQKFIKSYSGIVRITDMQTLSQYDFAKSPVSQTIDLSPVIFYRDGSYLYLKNLEKYKGTLNMSFEVYDVNAPVIEAFLKTTQASSVNFEIYGDPDIARALRGKIKDILGFITLCETIIKKGGSLGPNLREALDLYKERKAQEAAAKQILDGLDTDPAPAEPELKNAPKKTEDWGNLPLKRYPQNLEEEVELNTALQTQNKKDFMKFYMSLVPAKIINPNPNKVLIEYNNKNSAGLKQIQPILQSLLKATSNSKRKEFAQKALGIMDSAGMPTYFVVSNLRNFSTTEKYPENESMWKFNLNSELHSQLREIERNEGKLE